MKVSQWYIVACISTMACYSSSHRSVTVLLSQARHAAETRPTTLTEATNTEARLIIAAVKSAWARSGLPQPPHNIWPRLGSLACIRFVPRLTPRSNRSQFLR